LCAWQEELQTFQRWLEEILLRTQGTAAMPRIEQYQNRMIREQEVIDELQHLVKTHESSLEKRSLELPHIATLAPFRDHGELRDRMRTATHLHKELRREFMRWAAGRLGRRTSTSTTTTDASAQAGMGHVTN
jgi:hypothetical protein